MQATSSLRVGCLTPNSQPAKQNLQLSLFVYLCLFPVISFVNVEVPFSLRGCYSKVMAFGIGFQSCTLPYLSLNVKKASNK